MEDLFQVPSGHASQVLVVDIVFGLPSHQVAKVQLIEMFYKWIIIGTDKPSEHLFRFPTVG